MANDTSANVDGFEVSWRSVKLMLSINGGQTIELIDCEGAKWSTKLDTSVSRGTSGRPIKETEGEPSYEASIMMTKSGILQLKTALGAVAVSRGNQKILSSPRFSVQVLHQVMGSDIIYETMIKGSRYRGESEDNKNGTDAVINEIPIGAMEIVQIIDGVEHVVS